MTADDTQAQGPARLPSLHVWTLALVLFRNYVKTVNEWQHDTWLETQLLRGSRLITSSAHFPKPIRKI
jgi:hypothetical protein